LKNEKTSRPVAKIAAQVLDALSERVDRCGDVENSDGVCLSSEGPDGSTVFYLPFVTVGELKSLAASALTQRPDKPKGGRPKAAAK